jgi:hypothetical protein
MTGVNALRAELDTQVKAHTHAYIHTRTFMRAHAHVTCTCTPASKNHMRHVNVLMCVCA